MSWFKPSESSASERYQRRSFALLMVFAAMLFVLRSMRSAQAHGGHRETSTLFLVAGLSALPMVGIALALGAYLREEKDEYQRDIEVRGLLAGAAALLVLSVFFSFLHELGWTGYVAPVTEVMTFGMVSGGVKLGYRFRARVDGE